MIQKIRKDLRVYINICSDQNPPKIVQNASKNSAHHNLGFDIESQQMNQLASKASGSTIKLTLEKDENMDYQMINGKDKSTPNLN